MVYGIKQSNHAIDVDVVKMGTREVRVAHAYTGVYDKESTNYKAMLLAEIKAEREVT